MRATKTAWDVFNEGKGVCRDYAHLAITFCRCMNIPARYCTGYPVRTPAEVALRERVEAGPLVTHIEANALRYRADPVEVAGEPGKEFVERLQDLRAAAHACVDLAVCRCGASERARTHQVRGP
jgi:transglutaminase-like putative cysteine protease